VELLSGELAGELEEPLRSGIGIHIGTAVVGLVRTDESQSLQFLGDTGNVAAKLEAKTKELGCTLVVSLAALNLITPHAPWVETGVVVISGKNDPLKIAILKNRILEKFVWSSRRKIAKEKSENSDAMRTLEGCC
jgi:adenylate cyclase